MKKRGQIAPSTIVGIIIAVVVLVAIIIFFTGRFQAGAQQFSDLSPRDVEVALTSCQFACDSASTAVRTPDDCTRWEVQYCSRTVVVSGEELNCETGTPPSETGTDKLRFTCNPPISPANAPDDADCDCTT